MRLQVMRVRIGWRPWRAWSDLSKQPPAAHSSVGVKHAVRSMRGTPYPSLYLAPRAPLPGSFCVTFYNRLRALHALWPYIAPSILSSGDIKSYESYRYSSKALVRSSTRYLLPAKPLGLHQPFICTWVYSALLIDWHCCDRCQQTGWFLCICKCINL